MSLRVDGVVIVIEYVVLFKGVIGRDDGELRDVVSIMIIINEKKVTMNIVGCPFAKADEKSGVDRNEVMFFIFVFKLAANVAANVFNNFAEMNKVNAAHGVAGHFVNNSVTFIGVSR